MAVFFATGNGAKKVCMRPQSAIFTSRATSSVGTLVNASSATLVNASNSTGVAEQEMLCTRNYKQRRAHHTLRHLVVVCGQRARGHNVPKLSDRHPPRLFLVGPCLWGRKRLPRCDPLLKSLGQQPSRAPAMTLLTKRSWRLHQRLRHRQRRIALLKLMVLRLRWRIGPR
jgi:hypothetical protein